MVENKGAFFLGEVLRYIHFTEQILRCIFVFSVMLFFVCVFFLFFFVFCVSFMLFVVLFSFLYCVFIFCSLLINMLKYMTTKRLNKMRARLGSHKIVWSERDSANMFVSR